MKQIFLSVIASLDILCKVLESYEVLWAAPSPVGIYIFKVNNGNTRTCKLCSKLKIKTPEQRQWRRSGVFIVNLNQMLHDVLVFPLLNLNKQMPVPSEIYHHVHRTLFNKIYSKSYFQEFWSDFKVTIFPTKKLFVASMDTRWNHGALSTRKRTFKFNNLINTRISFFCYISTCI